MNKKILNTILGLLLSVVLVVVIIFEFKAGFDMLGNKKMANVNAMIEYASDYGKNSVSVEEVYVYDEVPEVDKDGEVFALDTYDVRIKLNGTITGEDFDYYGNLNYSSAKDSTAKTLHLDTKKTNLSDFATAYSKYWKGESSALLDFIELNYQPENITYYQQTYKDGNIPVVYNSGNNMYYMFINAEDSYMVLTAPEPFAVTNEKQTVHYGDPKENPMLSHTYSDYEEYATENTIRELQEKEEGKDVKNPYTAGDVAGTAATYTTESDNTRRKTMASYANYIWDENGKCSETKLYLDLTSDAAIKSQWNLTNTTFSYSNAGLQVHMLSATRSAVSFKISGTITNLINAERPYVIAMKFLNADGKLLKVVVLDNRTKQLTPNGSATFETEIFADKDKVETSTITAIQWEVY